MSSTLRQNSSIEESTSNNAPFSCYFNEKFTEGTENLCFFISENGTKNKIENQEFPYKRLEVNNKTYLINVLEMYLPMDGTLFLYPLDLFQQAEALTGDYPEQESVECWKIFLKGKKGFFFAALIPENNKTREYITFFIENQTGSLSFYDTGEYKCDIKTNAVNKKSLEELFN